MSQPKFYPEFSSSLRTTINTWKKLQEANPEYFDDPDCPYSFEEVELLKSVFTHTSNTQLTLAPDQDPLDDEDPDLEQEALQLFRDMKTFKKTLSNSDTSEMASTFRTTVSLLEKILDVRERASGLKQFSDFKVFILDSMERYLTPQQKTEFIDEMKLTLNQE